MPMAEKIKILLVKRKISVVQLAERLSTTPQNLYNKLGRDNFSENELRDIANALDCTYKAYFKMNDTEEQV